MDRKKTQLGGPGRRGFLKGALAAGAAGVAGAAHAATIIGASGEDKPAAAAPMEPSSRTIAAETMGTHADEVPKGHVQNPGSDFMVDVMRSAGIEYVSMMTSSALRGLQESIINYGGNKAPEIIVCCHEEGAVGMAHGYAKMAGKPMASMVHGVVGLQHASMAIYNAWCDRVPVIVLAWPLASSAMAFSGLAAATPSSGARVK